MIILIVSVWIGFNLFILFLLYRASKIRKKNSQIYWEESNKIWKQKTTQNAKRTIN